MATTCSFPFLATCYSNWHGTVNLRQSVWHTIRDHSKLTCALHSFYINEFRMAIWQYQSLKFDLRKE